MIASSVMNCVGSKKKHVEKRLLIILCFVFFLCGIPLTAQVCRLFIQIPAVISILQ